MGRAGIEPAANRHIPRNEVSTGDSTLVHFLFDDLFRVPGICTSAFSNVYRDLLRDGPRRWSSVGSASVLRRERKPTLRREQDETRALRPGLDANGENHR